MVKKAGCCSCVSTSCDVGKDTQIKVRLTDYMNNTCMHGPSGIMRSKNIFRRVAWILVLAAGWGMTVWQITTLIMTYYTWPTTTTVEIGYSSSLSFPAVTFCNINPVRESEVYAVPELERLFTTTTTTPVTSGKSWGDRIVSDFYEETDTKFQSSLDFLSAIAKLDDSRREDIGHNISTMLIGCTYKGYSCSPGNFSHFLNYKYGNCYTFNSGTITSVQTSERTGPEYGLDLTLYTEQADYIGEITTAAGFRLVVHGQGEMPFPEDTGISVMPGVESSVAVTKVNIKREVPPWGDCRSYSSSDNLQYNLWADEEEYAISYTDKACLKTCVQVNIIERCDCCSPYYPCEATALESYMATFNGSIPSCNLSSPIEYRCEENVFAMYKNGELTCGTYCKSPCSEYYFETSISSALWPATAALNDTANTLSEQSDALYDYLSKINNDIQTERFIKNNVAKIKVYYAKLNYEEIQTKASYDVSSLFSDIGGQIGLWIGLSVVTLFEFIELGTDLLMIAVMKFRGRGEDAVTPVAINAVKTLDEKPSLDSEEGTVGKEKHGFIS